MDEKVDLVEVLTRRVEDLQRGKTDITSVHCATQHKIDICTYSLHPKISIIGAYGTVSKEHQSTVAIK